MRKHYNLSKKVYKSLIKKGVSIRDFIKSVPLFAPHGSREPISKICLLYYIDTHGDFRKPSKVPHRMIAKALFSMLDAEDKQDIKNYLTWIEE